MVATDSFSDPEELFDVVDSRGRPTGQVKRRADVHRDGDWHRSLHCWVTDESGERPLLIFQRRGRHKDTWPLRLDPTVGGHFAHGESLDDVLREIEEEIGRAAALSDLIYLGRRACVNHTPGIRDHELQEVYLWRSRVPLADYRPQPVEVEALEAAAVEDVLRLMSGQVSAIDSLVLRPGADLSHGRMQPEDFVEVVDRYFLRVAVAVDLAIKGYPHPVI